MVCLLTIGTCYWWSGICLQDIMLLYKHLPNPIGSFRVPLSQFNHLDFLWGTDVKTLVYDYVIEIMTKYWEAIQIHTKLEVYTAMLLKIQVFWDVVLCECVNSYKHLEEAKYLHLHNACNYLAFNTVQYHTKLNVYCWTVLQTPCW